MTTSDKQVGAQKCPYGDHLIFTWPSGKIVPHYDNDGNKCYGSYRPFTAGPVVAPANLEREDLSVPEDHIFMPNVPTASQPVTGATPLDAATLKLWRELAYQGMHSALGEYTPVDEFVALLDEVERLRATPLRGGNMDSMEPLVVQLERMQKEIDDLQKGQHKLVELITELQNQVQSLKTVSSLNASGYH